MTYADCSIEYNYTGSYWNDVQYTSASGSLDISRPKWIQSVARKLETFRAYQAGWDSYGAHSIDNEALEHAKRFLNDSLFSNLDKPFITPTSNGGIQVEWNRDGKALELEFVSLTELHYFYSDSSGERESELHSNFEEARIAARDFID